MYFCVKVQFSITFHGQQIAKFADSAASNEKVSPFSTILGSILLKNYFILQYIDADFSKYVDSKRFVLIFLVQLNWDDRTEIGVDLKWKRDRNRELATCLDQKHGGRKVGGSVNRAKCNDPQTSF